MLISVRGKLHTELKPSFIVLSLALVFYTSIACKLGLGITDGGPDENMRALLPQCMIQGNLLPSGYDKCAIYNVGNWSYAFYPQFAGAYVSAVFMSIAKVLGLGNSAILVSGRLASVLFSGVALLFISKTIERIFRNHPQRNMLAALAIVFLGFWPQYAFLSSYINNDIVALAGVSILIFSLVSGISDGWGIGNCCALSTGVVITSLGYWNAYGYILVSVLVFLITVLRQNRNHIGLAWRYIATAALPAALVVLPFFVMNIIRYGDVLGTGPFKAQYQLWLDNGGTVLQHPWTGGLRALFLDTDFVHDSLQSFIGNLGYTAIPLPFSVFIIYIGLLFTGFGLFIAAYPKYSGNSETRLLVGGTLLAGIVTTLLFIYYVVSTDFQSQGRYVIYNLIPLIIMLLVGIGNALTNYGSGSSKRRVLVVLACIYVSFCVFFFIHSALFYGWSGVKLP